MKIVVFGAGAIGSLFGALLSKSHNVILVGRKSHVNAIKKNGLKIIGKTKLNVKISAELSCEDINMSPDLLILTVKSYDTEMAIKQAKKIVDKHTVVLSLQNGLSNIEDIKKHIDSNKIIAGITTHGAYLSKPGVIEHTGKGELILGSLYNTQSLFIGNIVKEFRKSGIENELSKNIRKEIWRKAIVNSSINPLTAFFKCKNGYLEKNPVLKGIVKEICKESTNVANTQGYNFSYVKMCDKTLEVIRKTSDNYSSMFQSLILGKKTEIDSINGQIIKVGNQHNIDTSLNQILFNLINKVNFYKNNF